MANLSKVEGASYHDCPQARAAAQQALTIGQPAQKIVQRRINRQRREQPGTVDPVDRRRTRLKKRVEEDSGSEDEKRRRPL